MNPTVIAVTLTAFLAPVFVVVAINWDSLAGIDDDTPPAGKLLYFYLPS